MLVSDYRVQLVARRSTFRQSRWHKYRHRRRQLLQASHRFRQYLNQWRVISKVMSSLTYLQFAKSRFPDGALRSFHRLFRRLEHRQRTPLKPSRTSSRDPLGVRWQAGLPGGLT